MVYSEVGIEGKTVIPVEEYLPPGSSKFLLLRDTLDFEVSNGYVYEKVLKPQPSTDPNDPLVRISRDKKLIKNWSRFRKYLAIFNVGFFLFQVDFSSSSLTICLPKIQLEVPIPDNVRTAFASAPLLFLGLGCIFWNPVCMKIGKRPGLVAANALFVAASIWTANAASMQTLLASRLLQGFAASAAHGMGPSCISDVSFLHERASKLALYEFCLGAGATLGPITAGAILRITPDWRWVPRTNAFLAVVGFILMFLTFPELNFDRRCALRYPTNGLGKTKTFTELLSFTDGYDKEASILKSLRRSLVLLKYPALPWAILNFGFPLGMFLAISIMLSIDLTEDPYTFRGDTVGLLHVAPLIGVICGYLLGGYVIDRCIQVLSRRNCKGIFEPEFRFVGLLPLVVCGPLGLLLFGFGYSAGNWIMSVVGWSFTMLVLTAVPNVAITYVIDAYVEDTVNAMTMLNATRNCLGAGFVFITIPLAKSIGVKKLFGLMTGIEVLIFLTAVPMYYYGKRFRIWTSKSYLENETDTRGGTFLSMY